MRCYDRTPRPDTIVTKSQPMTSVTTEWQSYIDRVCKSWLAASMEAVATALREMQDKAQAEREAMRKELRDEFKAELAQIRIELLTKMVDSERGKRHLKAVPESNAMVG